MKGIILAGGLGIRMMPATQWGNKHLFIVGGIPLVAHSIEALVQAGIKDILICSNGEDRERFGRVLGKGKEFGCNLFYRMEQEVRGSGQTILMAEPFVRGEAFALMHGDSVFFRPLPRLPNIQAPCLFAMPTPEEDFDDRGKYGQVRISISSGNVREIKKTPEHVSAFIQIALWIFPPSCFDVLRRLESEHAGEVHTDEVVAHYVARHEMRAIEIPARSYIDCGTPEAFKKAEELLQRRTG